MDRPSLLVGIAFAVAVFAMVRICIVGFEVQRNRRSLTDLERGINQSEALPVVSGRGLGSVLCGQWWAYGPLLLLAAVAYWRFGPGFEMCLMVGASVFWVITGVAEDGP